MFYFWYVITRFAVILFILLMLKYAFLLNIYVYTYKNR